MSGIALHNLRDLGRITETYRAIRGLLLTGGCFLNCDHFVHVGGPDAHMDALRAVGFAEAECLWRNEKTAIIRAA